MSFTTSSTIVCPNAGDNGSGSVPVGTVVNYAGATYPAGWLACRLPSQVPHLRLNHPQEYQP